MELLPVKTRPLIPPKDDLLGIFAAYLPRLVDGDIVVVTSKVVAIHQGRCRLAAGVDKDALIKQEADYFLPRERSYRKKALITIRGHTLLPSAGVDASNANGYYILWPMDLQETAADLRRYLVEKFKLRRLGLIITDSHSVPLRLGTLGVAIGFAGFKPLRDYRGQPDIFGRKLQATRANVPDALAAISVFLMGEGNEQTPLVVLRDVPGMSFTNKQERFFLSPEFDLYKPLWESFEKSVEQ